MKKVLAVFVAFTCALPLWAKVEKKKVEKKVEQKGKEKAKEKKTVPSFPVEMKDGLVILDNFSFSLPQNWVVAQKTSRAVVFSAPKGDILLHVTFQKPQKWYQKRYLLREMGQALIREYGQSGKISSQKLAVTGGKRKPYTIRIELAFQKGKKTTYFFQVFCFTDLQTLVLSMKTDTSPAEARKVWEQLLSSLSEQKGKASAEAKKASPSAKAEKKKKSTVKTSPPKKEKVSPKSETK